MTHRENPSHSFRVAILCTLLAASMLFAMSACSPAPGLTEPPNIRIRLVGVVRNAVTRTPIVGATATVTQGSRTDSATTFEGGVYLILNFEMRSGDAQLEVRAPGYQTVTRTIRLQEGVENTADVDLTPVWP